MARPSRGGLVIEPGAGLPPESDSGLRLAPAALDARRRSSAAAGAEWQTSAHRPRYTPPLPVGSGRSDDVTQAERLARREQLRADIAKRELELEQMRAEESRLLEGCEHVYSDGRGAATGGRVKICSICGRLLKARDEKLWG